ncbi:MAG: hypothetical protein IJF76_02815 [Clostridia bacterium]|nr:hypothetical protein [Clostridia bacterium]
MRFAWAGIRDSKNTRLSYELKVDKDCDSVVLYGADFYRIYIDGEFVAYGPERTAAGYARRREIKINGAEYICIDTSAYNVDTFCNDRQLPYLGVEIKKGDTVVYDVFDFECRKYDCVLDSKLRYSKQRGYMEQYDFTKTEYTVLDIYEVDSPILLEGIGDNASYEKVGFDYLYEREFKDIFTFDLLWWQRSGANVVTPEQFNVHKDFIEKAKGYREIEFCMKTERTGFIKLEVEADEDIEVFALFEEYIPKAEDVKVLSESNNIVGCPADEWFFRRSTCNDIIALKFPKGKFEFISSEPYAFKYLKLVVSGKATITPSLIALENKNYDMVKVSGNEKFKKVFEAAKNSFRQNALDIFMDCPGRERAGWLCDTYFTAKAERTLTGRNDIEKKYLENHLLAKHEEIDDRLFMMIFPGQSEGTYIPNWAMWFVIELEDYLARTGDREFVDNARDKVYGLVDFFKKYENEDGLLENLESWIFIEWSICNNPEYVKGVNYPSNMLYAYMLEKVYNMYGDESMLMRAKAMKDKIYEQSFNGEFFVDNAVREDGKLTLCRDHLSETCQYYALFTGFKMNREYVDKIIKEFGPLRKAGAYEKVGKSNMFIGNYLRFLWLCDIGESDRVITECLEYFAKMEEKTGTLWELDSPTASCNHGFTSVAAEILLRCSKGFVGVKDGKPVFDPNFQAKEDYGVEFEFNY